MAIVLFLLGLFSARAMVEVPSQEPAAYCGGAGGGGDGGDDGDDWGKWRGQWLLKVEEPKQKNINNKKLLVNRRNTLEMGSNSLMRMMKRGTGWSLRKKIFSMTTGMTWKSLRKP